ncbi:WbuC family cupin fold metalloprotein [Buttiauxella sp. S04-F03]|uniref:WbuC family cupin fold metalloprotein n=1 Tax=Buttiauxella sp. S04-F03 TaxID=2904525 RepID=UPI001E5B7D39|nr:WbuC family cupin fold metalloprotein [Buttiauxella sp. S04-F03]MCE0812482.1 WbuC family cupin fold metalloprotein [Buttiauxella sp. S04-F03]
MQLIDNIQLQQLYLEASKSERLRTHFLLHDSHQDHVQRLIIAMVQGSYVEPHYHELSNQWELFSVLDGVIKVTLYSTDGGVIQSFNAGPGEDISLIQFAAGDIHGIECLSKTALLLEVKEGPFNPEFAKVFPHWS